MNTVQKSPARTLRDEIKADFGRILQPTMSALGDAAFMIENEIQYIKTGKHPGVPMRDCLGQWESLAREIRALLKT